MNAKTILIASDHAGFALKEKLKPYLARLGLTAEDLGTYSRVSCDYPCFAAALAAQISKGKYRRGILICKTGIGTSIVANRFPGVRASLCYTTASARLTREHNDSNVLVLGAAFVNAAEARRIVGTWVKTPFTGGRHARRLSQIKTIERKIRCNEL
jgi:ribose 5-phosphate isomerase B